jgi:alkylhydroperoxidase family enzyme
VDVVEGKRDLRGSARERALAGFAHVLTEVPWAVNAADITRLRGAGISEEAIEQAILVTAFFNYFPRVADGAGIDFDYESPLPRISVDTTRDALPRFPKADWNLAVDGSTLTFEFPLAPHIAAILAPWRRFASGTKWAAGAEYAPIFSRYASWPKNCATLRHWGPWKDAQPANDIETHLGSFARKLTRTPWAMNASDVETLRAVSLSDETILATITLVAHQNAISRMHHALAAVRG